MPFGQLQYIEKRKLRIGNESVYGTRGHNDSLLKTNIQETVFNDLEAKIAAIDERLAELQQQMIDNSGDNALVEQLGFRWMTFEETARTFLPKQQNEPTCRLE